MPYGIAPNFLIDGKLYHIPMVVEESSVVAAASKSAKFWYNRGGFQTVSIKTRKKGQIHFTWKGEKEELYSFFSRIKEYIPQKLRPVTQNMEKRGGGVQSIELNDKTDQIENYYELDMTFETADSMGANFINSVLEKTAAFLHSEAEKEYSGQLEIIMSILSNYTPESVVKMKVETEIKNLNNADPNLTGWEFAEKFRLAVLIAEKNVSRAVTHNKGIMNGIDPVVIATGNDFRAVEANAHAYAGKTGKYRSLSGISTDDNQFRYELEIPLTIGTVGGLTRLHPLAEKSLELLGNPGAEELMKIIAAAGLANNFGAIRSLITTGIQKGHMKLHLDNILFSLNATPEQTEKAKKYFKDHTVSVSEVQSFLNQKS
jgi:hydroxymethylglutaryl-CoA reductase